MKRVVAMVIAGLALIVACNSGDDYGYGYAPPPTAFAGGSSGAVIGTSASGDPSLSGTANAYCSDRPFCGSRGCCPPGWRCLRDRCVAPGVTCTSDADCTSDRYCALEVVEPRCFPRDNFCEPGKDAGPDCIYATCGPGPDVHLTKGRASCADVTLYLYNFGRGVLPPGAIVAIDSRPRALDAEADAGDAGDAGDASAADAGPLVTTITTETKDGVLPGEVVLLRLPLATDYGATLEMRVVHDAGAAAADCDPHNDTDPVDNGCAIPK